MRACTGVAMAATTTTANPAQAKCRIVCIVASCNDALGVAYRRTRRTPSSTPRDLGRTPRQFVSTAEQLNNIIFTARGYLLGSVRPAFRNISKETKMRKLLLAALLPCLA